MIGIATITANAAGAVLIDDRRRSDAQTATARISRAKTLDGGVCITHSGFSHGDRTINVDATITEAQASTLWTIFTGQTMVLFSNDEGCFDAYLNSIDIKGGALALEVYLKAKLSS